MTATTICGATMATCTCAICSEYPWYDQEPRVRNLPDRCSFWADLPAELRPTEWVPVEIGAKP
jgi:hypothetical protein